MLSDFYLAEMMEQQQRMVARKKSARSHCSFVRFYYCVLRTDQSLCKQQRKADELRDLSIRCERLVVMFIHIQSKWTIFDGETGCSSFVQPKFYLVETLVRVSERYVNTARKMKKQTINTERNHECLE